jgi:ribosomal-protein-alanine N-acetyltransferase
VQCLPPHDLRADTLLLSACRDTDAQSLFANYTNDKTASEFLQRHPHQSVSETERLVANWGLDAWGNASGQYAWTIKQPQNQEALGLFCLLLQNHQAEIHFGLSPRHWNKGYATHAGSAVTTWLKSQPYVSRIYTFCDVTHIACHSVLHKIGLTNIRTLPGYLLLAQKGYTMRDAYLFEWTRPVGLVPDTTLGKGGTA